MNACAFECSGISFYPKSGLEVSLVPPKIDCLRKLHVEDFYEKNNRFFIKFEEIKEKTELQQFDSMHLLVSGSVAKTLEKPLQDELIGWKVKDTTSDKEFIVQEVIDMPTQQIAVCEGEVQVILHEDLIEGLDEASKTITVKLPENYFEEF